MACKDSVAKHPSVNAETLGIGLVMVFKIFFIIVIISSLFN
jgi:hypothetical protein